MKKSLYFNEVILVGLLTFGLFFGAGNLIFPVLLGQMAGDNLWTASFGFLFELGFGWVIPTVLGLFVGLLLHFFKQKKC